MAPNNGQENKKPAPTAPTDLTQMADLIKKMERIHFLSEKPPNPGYAYRHLEHIHALSENVIQRLQNLEKLQHLSVQTSLPAASNGSVETPTEKKQTGKPSADL
jgi:hypothetical protein